MSKVSYQRAMFGLGAGSLSETDPEFAALFSAFAGEEVPNADAAQLPERERYLAILAALLGCQGLEVFRIQMSCALDAGIDPIEVREVAYQATAYLGMGRTYPFIQAATELFAKRGIALPLRAQGTTTPETRLAAGNRVQMAYFGDGMRESWITCSSERAPINEWLADNCFGDYYTRSGLSDRDREMVTFCLLAAQGGCEPQLRAHIQANIGLGNDKDVLYRVVFQCLPYIGYPRSLNALACIDDAVK